MNNIDVNLMEELCFVQIAFAQMVVKRHKEGSPESLDAIAENWIEYSESWDERVRLAGLYSLIHFFRLKKSHVSKHALKLFEKEASRIEIEGISTPLVFFRKRYSLSGIMKQVLSKYER